MYDASGVQFLPKYKTLCVCVCWINLTNPTYSGTHLTSDVEDNRTGREISGFLHLVVKQLITLIITHSGNSRICLICITV